MFSDVRVRWTKTDILILRETSQGTNSACFAKHVFIEAVFRVGCLCSVSRNKLRVTTSHNTRFDSHDYKMTTYMATSLPPNAEISLVEMWQKGHACSLFLLKYSNRNMKEKTVKETCEFTSETCISRARNP